MKSLNCKFVPRTPEQIAEDYTKFAGRCKELAEAEIAKNPELRLVRGWYDCPMWGQRQHWWCEDKHGNIVDPSVRQFPTAGAAALYEEFDGYADCEYCQKRTHEDKAYMVDHHFYCSATCYGRDVGF